MTLTNNSEDRLLSEKDWRSLLREINRGQVIPVVGPGLVTVDLADGTSIPLHQHLAPTLACALGLETPERFRGYNEVARDFLLNGGERRELYTELRLILDDLDVAPSAALCQLASITDFNLFFAGTPDPLLVRAVQSSRPEFSPERGIMRFHPAGIHTMSDQASVSGSDKSPCDLPVPLVGPLVYHILGDYDTYPDFAIWEEDYMEFICGLIENRDTLENLFTKIRDRNLLLLGAPSDDWIVRFFLRAARGERLSDRQKRQKPDYLADHCGQLGESMIFFFDKAIRSTRIIDGSPAQFVTELARRWHEAYGTAVDEDSFLKRQPDEMPRDSVFISYSRDDVKLAVQIGRKLAAAGIPVWLDMQRLQPGQNYEPNLERAIKDSAFFLALISRATEANATRCVHQERVWATQKHAPGWVFYIPLIIDDIPDPEIKLEPPCFAKIHRERMSDKSFPGFVKLIQNYMDQYRESGRPRG